jgi:hypothetical protein
VKFLALKAALDKALPVSPLKPDSKLEVPSIEFFSPAEKKQTVVGSTILRTPIDRTAAMVTAKAPWWAHPPVEPFPPIPQIQTPQNKRLRPMESNSEINRSGKSFEKNVSNLDAEIPKGGTSLDYADEMKCRGTSALAISTIERTKQLVDIAFHSKIAMDEINDGFRKSYEEFSSVTNDALKSFIQTRMTCIREMNEVKSTLKDLRNFLCDDKHDQEIARLRELVDLIDRLLEHKKSGNLELLVEAAIRLHI